jgi:ribosome-binding factor A
MKSFSRSEKVSGLIHKTLSEFLYKQVSDPRLERVTITGVKMSPDLRIAKIYFTTYGDKTAAEEIAEGFKSARGYMKRNLAGKLGLRYMPEFQFFYDDSLDRGRRIDNLLKSVQQTHGTDNSPIEE